MAFNSLDFALFLPFVFAIYWLLDKQRYQVQNIFLILASYTFYAFWDWRFLGLIIFSTLVDYNVGTFLGKTSDPTKRKWLAGTSIVLNIGLLGFFKYYNFFVDSFVAAFSLFGKSLASPTLDIILPVGISFYTLQTLSYTLDVYRKKIEPYQDLTSFAAYVAFFPQLVAGPIERAAHFLPQFQQKRHFYKSHAIIGLRQILWGLFKKVVIADNCGHYVDAAFGNSAYYTGSALFIAAFLFSIQIYCDFSGYTDIAIGTAKQFGFRLSKNFNYPYFSRDIAEFWRRWHISLSSWFRDYVYFPLGGSRVVLWKKIRNLYIIFLVIGLWHGAHWKFVFYGALNATFYLPLLLTGRNRKHLDTVAKGKTIPSYKDLLKMGSLFMFLIFSRVFFRAESLEQALLFIKDIFSKATFALPNLGSLSTMAWLFLGIVLCFVVEWIGREDAFALEKAPDRLSKPARHLTYYGMIFCIFYFAVSDQQFIYFQF